MDWVDQYFIFGLFWAFFGVLIIIFLSPLVILGNLIVLGVGIGLLIIGTLLMIDAISRRQETIPQENKEESAE
jgi:hypothetical protein